MAFRRPRSNDGHRSHVEQRQPMGGVLRKVADLVLHERQVPNKGRVMAPGMLHGAKRRWTIEQVRTMRRRWKRHHFERLNDLIAAAGRRRITYKELTA